MQAYKTLLLVLLPVFLSSCAGNSATGGADVNFMSERKANSIGQEMYDKMVADGVIYDDVELQAYIVKVGQRLVANSDTPKDKFTFTVINSADINAFATPGGFVYINRGLLAYLDNEAELAGVLSHEIAHVTARHSARQQTASITNKVLATTLGVLTNNRNIMDSVGMYGAELISGYGREHELEADELGARYMHTAGYEADALLEVIGVLKNHEQYQRIKKKASGKKTATYHGLYATHPRNDARLQTVIRAAGELELAEGTIDPEIPGEFRHHIQDLPWGTSGRALRADRRYYHNKLAFTFEKPKGWTVETSGKSIVANSDDGTKTLTVTIKRQDRSQTPEQMLRSKVSDLDKGEELNQAGLKGYTGKEPSRRVAAIYYNGLAYLLEGKVNNGGSLAAADPDFLKMIKSFRAMAKSEIKKGKPRVVRYIQVPRGTTFAKLATGVRIPDAETTLRLINGYYPRGEPRTGDWVKVIR